MTSRSLRESLTVQLLDTRRMIELAGGHPLMAQAFEAKEKELEEKIQNLPPGNKEARTILYFSGTPVVGSVGIDANFTSQILAPFQSMVMADYADHWHGSVGTRGKIPGESASRLLLTALPRGSVGLELSRSENDDFFTEDQLADTLSHVVKVIESAATGDTEFASELTETSPRVIQYLKSFLHVIVHEKAGLRIEAGDYRCTLNPQRAEDAFNRVASAVANTLEMEVSGTFRGVLLDSWRFDFVPGNGGKISGKPDDSLSEDQVAELSKEFLNKWCIAKFECTTITFRNGKERKVYVLKNLRRDPNEAVE